MKKVISFLENPWVNLITGILGFFGILGCLFNYSCFDLISVFVGFFFYIFIDIFCFGFISLIKKKRNSPLSGEDK